MQPGMKWLTLAVVILFPAVEVRAQTPLPNLAGGDCDRPTQLPPLLTPPGPPVQGTPGSRSPGCSYDPGYLYLPEEAPPGPKLPPCPCRPLGNWWLIPTFDMGWSESPHLPGLVRSGSPTGPVVYGNDRLALPFRTAVGLSTGVWLDRCQTQGVDAGFFYLGTGGNETTIYSGGPPLSLPFASLPGLVNPAVTTPLTAAGLQALLEQRFVTADVNYRGNLYCETNGRVDLLIGYRYADLRESLTLDVSEIGSAGDLLASRDSLTVNNQFHGGQIGIAGEFRLDDWYVSAVKKLAFGAVVTDVHSGALSRNQTRFGVMPALTLTVGRQLGEHCRVFGGYNLQYLSGAVRPEDAIDGLAVGGKLGTADFWVQTITLGLDVRY